MRIGEKCRCSLVFVIMIWIVGILPDHINVCTAKSVKSSNSSYHSECSGSLHDCQFPDLEWLMDSEISRMLAGQRSTVHISQAATRNAKQQAVPCGHGQSYTSCLPRDKNTVDPGKENCGGVYKCPHNTPCGHGYTSCLPKDKNKVVPDKEKCRGANNHNRGCPHNTPQH